jgi:branched-subunit amino acid ABC-type transport system permease component
MEQLLQQLLAGLATGAIYASMALAVVMIYQAIDHLNFAQGEMAMFSTFLAWQMLQWGWPYWAAFIVAVALSPKRADLKPACRVHRPLRHTQQLRRMDLGFQHQNLPDTLRLGPVVR